MHRTARLAEQARGQSLGGGTHRTAWLEEQARCQSLGGGMHRTAWFEEQARCQSLGGGTRRTTGLEEPAPVEPMPRVHLRCYSTMYERGKEVMRKLLLHENRQTNRESA